MLVLKRFYDSIKRTSNYHVIDNDNNLVLQLSYEGNGDLSWSIRTDNSNTKAVSFHVNYDSDPKLYDVIDDISKLIIGNHNKDASSNSKIYTDIEKTGNRDSKIIKWISDDTSFEKANTVIMYKKENDYILEFTRNNEMYHELAVKCKMNSPRYDSFYAPFMYAYRRLDRLYISYGVKDYDEPKYKQITLINKTYK